MSTELKSVKGTLIKLGFYPDEKSLLSDAFRALFQIRPELKTEIAVERYKKGDISLWGAARAAGCNLEELRRYSAAGELLLKFPQQNGKAMQD